MTGLCHAAGLTADNPFSTVLAIRWEKSASSDKRKRKLRDGSRARVGYHRDGATIRPRRVRARAVRARAKCNFAELAGLTTQRGKVCRLMTY